MTADPFKQAAKANDSGSWNKYSYTQNNPTNHTDRTGRWIDYPGLDCGPDEECDLQLPPGYEPIPQRPTTQPIECRIRLWNQSAVIENDPAQHTFLELISYDPNSGASTDVFVEGVPSTEQFGPIVMGHATLNSSVLGGNSKYSTTPNLRQEFTSTAKSDICAAEINIDGRVNGYRNDVLVYDPIYGPNSNSFTFTLLYTSGLSPSIFNLTYLLIAAPGWGIYVQGL